MSQVFTVHVHYRHRKTGILASKTFSLTLENVSATESILRSAFSIPDDEGLLLHCNDTIFYPINSTINLTLASSTPSCELQSFPLAAMEDITSSVKADSRPSKKSKTSKAARDSSEQAKEDKRKYNRGLNIRRSYLKEEKIFVMLMKDAAKSADEISQMTGVSKSNVEKWCSDRIRERTLPGFRQEVRHPVVEEALHENSLHFSMKEPAKVKVLLEVLAQRLHLAQNHSQQHHNQQGSANNAGPVANNNHNQINNNYHYQIPQSIFWQFISEQTTDKNSGKKSYLTIYSVDLALRYVIDQGYFFSKKKDKDSDRRDKDSSLAANTTIEDEDDLSLNQLPPFSFPGSGSAFPPVNISLPSSSDIILANKDSSAFLSSEESEMMMDFALDDQSIASSQWLPLPPPQTSNLVASQSNPSQMIPPENRALSSYHLHSHHDDQDNDHDEDLDSDEDDLDCDEINDLLLQPDHHNNLNNPSNRSNNDKNLDYQQEEEEDLRETLIRQGVVPKAKPCKVCSKPIECREEFLKLLRDNCVTGAGTGFVKSDCTMQFRGRISCSVPVNENLPNRIATLTAFVPLHAERSVLRNTKYLTVIRDSVKGKVLSAEEEEDAAVLSLLGE